MTAFIESSVVKLVPFDLASNSSSGPLGPVVKSGGLVFQYTPTISESLQVNYDKSGDIVHSNESFYVYKNTENTKLSVSEAVFTADTVENAQYMMAAVHFLRSYVKMDQGSGRTGKPPVPMWFSAYGSFAYDRVPVLVTGGDFSWSKDVDMVPVPNPGSGVKLSKSIVPTDGQGPLPLSLTQAIEKQNRDGVSPGDITWMPAKITINLQMVVQHSPKYWTSFNLGDFKSGKMVRKRDSTGALTGTRTHGARDSSGKTTEPVTRESLPKYTGPIPIIPESDLNRPVKLENPAKPIVYDKYYYRP